MGGEEAWQSPVKLTGSEAYALSSRGSEILMSLSLFRGRCSLEDDISN